MQLSPTNKGGRAAFRVAAPVTQMSHVNRIQVAWAPTEEMEYFDHTGCKNRTVYVPAVIVVQQAENLSNCMTCGTQASSECYLQEDLDSGMSTVVWGVTIESVLEK
jgi:hypothetical protein